MSHSTEGEESRRDQILRAATMLFSEKTFHGTSVKDIADAVGILKSSLYYYISGKEKLLADIILETVKTLKEDLSRVESAEVTPVEGLRQIISAIVRFNTGYREVGILWLTEQHVISSLEMDEVTEMLKQRNKFLEKTLDEGIKMGVFRPVDVRMASLAIVGLCNSVLAWYRPSGRLSDEKIADFFCEFVTGGLLTSS